ncbi:MAG: UvrB/UvrC motif-containing protein [Lachnospiraceae bacterium]|nr:UvrB/UvrC motif-containing protein [Lachnospiraceae bacterium]
MLCDKCHSREATITLTTVMGEQTKEIHLCGECARSAGWGKVMQPEFLARILSALFGGMVAEPEQEDEATEEGPFSKIVCPTCHTRYYDFVQNSMFGCPDCYSTFSVLIGNNIRELQGHEVHTGKKPKYVHDPSRKSVQTAKSAEGGEPSVEEIQKQLYRELFGNDPDPAKSEEEGAQESLEIYESRLKEALREEDYEAAAKYRDLIRDLKKRSGKE